MGLADLRLPPRPHGSLHLSEMVSLLKRQQVEEFLLKVR